MDFGVSTDYWVKVKGKVKEAQKAEKYLDHARKVKKTVRLEGDSNTNRSWHSLPGL